MRTVSADISRDEQIHVAVNSLAHAELGYNISPSLDKLRKATINWVMQPLGEHTDKYLNKKFWLESSDRLMYEGKAPQLARQKLLGCLPSLNIPMSTSPNTLDHQYRKLEYVLEQLSVSFPPQTIGPTDSIESIMYRAGQTSVVDFIKDLIEN